MQGCIIKGLFPGNVKKLYREIENHGIMKFRGFRPHKRWIRFSLYCSVFCGERAFGMCEAENSFPESMSGEAEYPLEKDSEELFEKTASVYLINICQKDLQI